MKANLSVAIKICAGLLCVLPGTAVLGAELIFQRVPTAMNQPASENLARYDAGAQIEVVPQSNSVAGLQLSSKTDDNNTAEAALLYDDPTIGYPLPNGTSTILISFPKIENIDSISFSNRNARGSVTIAKASAKLPADSPQWHEISQQQIDGEVLKAQIGPVEAKYVQLRFDLKDSGRIAGLRIFATPSSDPNHPVMQNVSFQSDNAALIGRNLTTGHPKSRVLYITSGADLRQANNIIDNQPTTAFSFAADDVSPSAIIDLGKVTSIRRISALYSRRPGRMEFFVLQSLPGIQSANHGLTLDGMTLARLIPAGSVNDGGAGRAAVGFPVTAGRYVIVKWTPNNAERGPFSISEVAVFGGAETPSLIAANITREPASDFSAEESDGKDYDSKDFAEGKDFKEGKEAPEAPAEGPSSPLPPPPPFQFVPVVGPVSP